MRKKLLSAAVVSDKLQRCVMTQAFSECPWCLVESVDMSALDWLNATPQQSDSEVTFEASAPAAAPDPAGTHGVSASFVLLSMTRRALAMAMHQDEPDLVEYLQSELTRREKKKNQNEGRRE